MEAVLFDLDGTLLDTARDFFSVINELLSEHKKPLAEFSVFRKNMAGTKDMVEFAFGKEHPGFDQLHSELEMRYLKNCTKHTCFFDEVESLLDYLDEQKIPWGIVTNKPTSTTQLVVQHFRLHHRTTCIISGDTLPRKKPDPLPLQHACQLLGVPCHEAVYIGDMQTDVEAAKRAGMKSIVFSHGYHPVHPKSWPASHAADHVAEYVTQVIEWLKCNREESALMAPRN
ncbi:MAG: hypothetical protein A3I77_07275 [Gammaproteobacteria bacterium RIFCSPLOWO2_02_FULL_42_14]|nr:MAG: hypothetical protein A3B71_03110 [Gammaproteobacteria bacterium RIFCSPHIGHO2_02_FULL_42_43]OGT29141.1 MAG: hypothetical protein A2624_04230 [Gammaproteobacteria bacterium RIFCSPHIGHO2_01_FULL_42_8]OGT52481.1 MAG: hypothetical protein A3E54_00590 [Gammaproteobacteria bacterium RIFCSPHIGHO2_12_FULL_41_25]OGT61358.1 MAG: hypothetical protein A3I77_07275 [Gammaproteobacteria bacterium RIFCSPLOWO2_02_FULL_42_14]OGT87286.1 MAG: hypothetical protein A3G86_00995 [Gammaproteobacteria bacterium R